MTQATSHQGQEPEPTHGLIDVSDLPLEDLLAAEETPFAHTFREFLAQAGDASPKVLAAFQSFLEE